MIRTLAALLALVLLTACGAPAAEPTPTPTAPATPDRLVYEVTSDSDVVVSADITYRTASGTEQQQGVDVPLRMQGKSELGMPLVGANIPSRPYISAQSSTKAFRGAISCRITLNGVELASGTSYGRFAVVTCSA